jgi:hypothetical protein
MLEDVAATGRGFETGGRSDKEFVAEGGAGPLEGAADGGLREQQAASGGSDGLFFGDDREGDEEVEVDLAKFL